jgi:hypothetical protein
MPVVSYCRVNTRLSPDRTLTGQGAQVPSSDHKATLPTRCCEEGTPLQAGGLEGSAPSCSFSVPSLSWLACSTSRPETAPSCLPVPCEACAAIGSTSNTTVSLGSTSCVWQRLLHEQRQLGAAGARAHGRNNMRAAVIHVIADVTVRSRCFSACSSPVRSRVTLTSSPICISGGFAPGHLGATVSISTHEARGPDYHRAENHSSPPSWLCSILRFGRAAAGAVRDLSAGVELTSATGG